MTCPDCHSTDVELEDQAAEDGVLVRLYVWACRLCPRKWATN